MTIYELHRVQDTKNNNIRNLFETIKGRILSEAGQLGYSLYGIFFGLFGLASFTAEQRVKEIGIRKVLGASVLNLWQMLSKDFVMLVFTSCIIAIPIGWYGMNEWLKGYEYKTNIGIGIFVAVVSIAMAITLITVSFQAVKAAMSNPVKSLRTE